MTDSFFVSPLEQAAYSAVRGILPAAELRTVLTAYLASWRLRQQQDWSRLTRPGRFVVIPPSEKIRRDRAEGTAVIILSRNGESYLNEIEDRCERVKAEGAAYVFVMTSKLLRLDLLPGFVSMCDGVFFTLPWVGDYTAAPPKNCHAIRTGPVQLSFVPRMRDSP